MSAQNDCYYCQTIHGSIPAAHLNGNEELVAKVKLNFAQADISEKLKALLAIAGKVQRSGKQVSDRDIAAARRDGAMDKEIHDTVLIAAAFCMFNRYVDGLGTWAPDERGVVSRPWAQGSCKWISGVGHAVPSGADWN